MPQEDIKLNKRIYSRSSIVYAIRAFKKVADLDLAEDKKYYVVKIGKTFNNAQSAIKDEFCNYVLSVM